MRRTLGCRFQPLFTGRALVVEDNVVNRQVARATLRGFGLDVVEAENGSRALEAIRSGHFDLIFMDMNMPVMDGLEATQHLRVAETAGELVGHRTVIAMTADVLPTAIAACREAGMDDFLPKPFQRAQLVELLSRWLPKDKHRVSDTEDVASSPAASTAQRGGPAIDLAVYGDTAKAMAEDLPLLIDQFFVSTGQLIEDMTRAAADGDSKGIRRGAHTLRSSAAAVGALALSQLAADIEAHGSAETFASQNLGRALLGEFQKAREELVRLALKASPAVVRTGSR